MEAQDFIHDATLLTLACVQRANQAGVPLDPTLANPAWQAITSEVMELHNSWMHYLSKKGLPAWQSQGLFPAPAPANPAGSLGQIAAGIVSPVLQAVTQGISPTK